MGNEGPGEGKETAYAPGFYHHTALVGKRGHYIPPSPSSSPGRRAAASQKTPLAPSRPAPIVEVGGCAMTSSTLSYSAALRSLRKPDATLTESEGRYYVPAGRVSADTARRLIKRLSVCDVGLLVGFPQSWRLPDRRPPPRQAAPPRKQRRPKHPQTVPDYLAACSAMQARVRAQCAREGRPCPQTPDQVHRVVVNNLLAQLGRHRGGGGHIPDNEDLDAGVMRLRRATHDNARQEMLGLVFDWLTTQRSACRTSNQENYHA